MKLTRWQVTHFFFSIQYSPFSSMKGRLFSIVCRTAVSEVGSSDASNSVGMNWTVAETTPAANRPITDRFNMSVSPDKLALRGNPPSRTTLTT